MRNETNSWREACIVAIALLALLIASISTQAQRKLSGPGRYEGENLVNSGKAQVNGGSVAAQPMSGFGTGWSGNAQLFWGGGSPGAVLDLTLDVAEEGIYEVELHMTRAPDFGRLRIQVDNKSVEERFDGYAPAVTPSGPISVGRFTLERGARKVSFMIDGKNPQSSNYFAGIDFIRINKTSIQSSKMTNTDEVQSVADSRIRQPKGTQPSKTLSDGSIPKWSVTSMGFLTPPTTPGVGGKDAYKEGDAITVKCSYEPLVPGDARLRIRDHLMDGTFAGKLWIQYDAAISKAGTQTISFVVGHPGNHFFECGVAIFDQTKWTYAAEEHWLYLDDGSLPFQVVAGIVPKETKWPDAPIIQTPIQNGKITVKAFDVSASCTDGGSFMFEFKRAEEISPGHWGNWQPLKVMWKPLACVAEGSTKDVSGMKPGHYQVRTRLINGKYKFTSDWSDWMFFDIPEK